MKSILFSILFLFIPKLAVSQVSENDKMILLDSTFNETKNQNHPYYRIIRDYKSTKESYVFNDYTISGTLIMEGISKNKDYISKEGKCTYYYPTGTKKKEGNFVKDRLNGKQSKWYENGNKKEEGEQILLDEKGTKSIYKINQFWNVDGIQKVTDGNGEYEDQEKSFFGKGKIKNGLKDGEWQGWVDKPEIKYTENYKDGQFISGKIIEENNVEREYDVLETKPKPQKGIQDFYKYIGQNFKVPNLAFKMTDKIFISFVVDENGAIVEPKILKGAAYGINDESIRVLTSYENWIPGERRGKKVRCSYTLPITLKL